MPTFGRDFEENWPNPVSPMPISSMGRRLLEKCRSVPKPDRSKANINDLLTKSANFPIEFGTNTCRVKQQPRFRYAIIEQQMASAYPLIHERVLRLYMAFLEHKIKFGTKLEKDLFSRLTVTDFVQRLLTHRAVCFFGLEDNFRLINKVDGCGGFMRVGTPNETKPLRLKNVLSYDEIKLSAFLSISSYSELLNDGNRYNEGMIEKDPSKIETEGLVIGLIGARFERPGLMEYQDIVITEKQNTKEKGYGLEDDEGLEQPLANLRRLWQCFYERDFAFEQVEKDGQRFGDTYSEHEIFDNLVMKKRYTISFDTLLLESDARAAAEGRQAYIHVVGYGLGMWKIAEHQEQVFLETFAQRLKALLPNLLHINAVHFSWFHLSEWKDLRDGGIFKHRDHPEGGIRTFLSVRNPAERLAGSKFEDNLLVISYTCDANSLPGNEFFMDMLSVTGNSSTACSTLISELHNPHINTEFICGNNLHIATEQYGIIHISDYAIVMLERDSV